MTALRVLGALVCLLFVGIAFTPLANVVAERLAAPARIESADAIVVLGGGVHPDGTLTSASMRRAVYGVALLRRRLAPLLCLLGPGRRRGPAEEDVRARLVGDLGVAPSAVVTVTGGRTTREEAFRVRDALWPHGARYLLLVTDSQHMVRAEATFAAVGFTVRAAPVDDFSLAGTRPEDRLVLARRVAEEILARFYYRAAGYFAR